MRTQPLNTLNRISLIAILLMCAPGVEAQCIVSYSESLPAPPLDMAVKDSDVIVRGTIARAQVVVDHDVVWTEYSVNTTSTVFQRLGTPPNGRVGAVNAIVFRISGGTGTVRGELITALDPDYPEGVFRIGSEHVLMLKYFPEIKSYSPTDGPYSVFRVEGGRIEPLKKSPHETRTIEGISINRFVQMIQRLLPNK